MREHGYYDLTVNINRVTFIAYDSWNYEAIVKWAEEFKEIVLKLNNEPWACLVDLTQWELGVPETREHLYELYKWLNNQNLKYLAVVFGSSMQQSLLEKPYQILTNVERKYYTDIEQANHWLSNYGF